MVALHHTDSRPAQVDSLAMEQSRAVGKPPLRHLVYNISSKKTVQAGADSPNNCLKYFDSLEFFFTPNWSEWLFRKSICVLCTYCCTTGDWDIGLPSFLGNLIKPVPSCFLVQILLLCAWVLLRPEVDCASMPETSIEEVRVKLGTKTELIESWEWSLIWITLRKRQAAGRVQTYEAWLGGSKKPWYPLILSTSFDNMPQRLRMLLWNTSIWTSCHTSGISMFPLCYWWPTLLFSCVWCFSRCLVLGALICFDVWFCLISFVCHFFVLVLRPTYARNYDKSPKPLQSQVGRASILVVAWKQAPWRRLLPCAQVPWAMHGAWDHFRTLLSQKQGFVEGPPAMRQARIQATR